MMKTWLMAGLAVWMFGWTAPALRAQDEAGRKTETYGDGRIIRADGTKIFVSWFRIEAGIDRVAYADDRQRKLSDPELLFLALSMVRSIQVRQRPTFATGAQFFLMGTFAGGVVSLLAADQWGGPRSATWPGIGAATVACAAIVTVIGLTVKRYRTVYTNPDLAPKPIIKLEMGPVAPRTPGVSLSLAY